MTVRTEVIVPLAAGVTEAGDRPQVTVALTGATAQLKATAELNKFKEVTVIVEVPVLPATTVAKVGKAVRLKSFTFKA